MFTWIIVSLTTSNISVDDEEEMMMHMSNWLILASIQCFFFKTLLTHLLGFIEFFFPSMEKHVEPHLNQKEMFEQVLQRDGSVSD